MPQKSYDLESNVLVSAFTGSPSTNPCEATLSMSGDAGSTRPRLPPVALHDCDGESLIVGPRIRTCWIRTRALRSGTDLGNRDG